MNICPEGGYAARDVPSLIAEDPQAHARGYPQSRGSPQSCLGLEQVIVIRIIHHFF